MSNFWGADQAGTRRTRFRPKVRLFSTGGYSAYTFSALILHLGLSLMVWTAVCKRGKWLWLFPAAIALHALVDAGAVILQQSVGNVPLEIIITAEALAAAAIGDMVTKKWLAISPENPLG